LRNGVLKGRGHFKVSILQKKTGSEKEEKECKNWIVDCNLEENIEVTETTRVGVKKSKSPTEGESNKKRAVQWVTLGGIVEWEHRKFN